MEALRNQAAQLRDQVMPDLQAALAQAQVMQQKLVEAQKMIAEAEVVGQAGGGLVQITLSGNGKVTSVHIDPQVVDPNDVETLQDLVVGAFENAGQEMAEMVKTYLGPIAAMAPNQQQPGFGV
jgi:DNA-binding YbaB/EbfC family protein